MQDSGQIPRGRPRSPQAYNAVLKSTLKLLETQSFSQLTIEAVAAKSGVSKPTIYRNWPSKLELAVDAVVTLAPPLTSLLEATDTSAQQTVRRIVPEIIEGITTTPFGRVILGLVDDGNSQPDLAGRIQVEYLQPRREILRIVIRRAIQSGELKPDTDPDLMLDFMFGPATYQWLTTGQPIQLEAARKVVDIVWGMFAVPGYTTTNEATA